MIDYERDCIDTLWWGDHSKKAVAITKDGNKIKGVLIADDSYFDDDEEIPVFIFKKDNGVNVDLLQIDSLYFYKT